MPGPAKSATYGPWLEAGLRIRCRPGSTTMNELTCILDTRLNILDIEVGIVIPNDFRERKPFSDKF